MPIPAGLDVAYVYCLLWAMIGMALLAALHPLASVETIKQTTSRRTSARLLALNDWIDRQVDRTWDRFPGSTIPDENALFALRIEVDRAYSVQRLMDRRNLFLEFGRLLAALHISAAVVAGVALLSGVDRSIVRAIGATGFTVGIILVVIDIVLVILCSMGILRGSDL